MDPSSTYTPNSDSTILQKNNVFLFTTHTRAHTHTCD
uniref:Uncharacterized protein n=1 Tax=Anguilla anguilla TaxID=7936 RepID=A0A0E9XLB1_ANGAN